MRAALVHDVIDPSALLREVSSASTGATVLFLGTVRDVNDGRDVTGIDYLAYEGMAAHQLQVVAREAVERFGTEHIVIEHRVGTLTLTDISVAIAVSHAHRGAAYEASRYMIEQLKQRVPIWKREHYVDGTREWVDPTRASVSVAEGEP